MHRVLGALVVAAVLAGCADNSREITSSYVSPIKYGSYSCVQLEQEYARVLTRSAEINQKQDAIASNDAAAMSVGMILFWPALFFIDSDDHKEEVARLKGEIDAVENSSVQKNCRGLSQQIVEDRQRAILEEEKRREALRKEATADDT